MLNIMSRLASDHVLLVFDDVLEICGGHNKAASILQNIYQMMLLALKQLLLNSEV